MSAHLSSAQRAQALKINLSLSVALSCALMLMWLGALSAQPVSGALARIKALDKPKEVSLVSQDELERHNLPATQRSMLHVAARYDSVAYYNDAVVFFGVGGPMLSWKLLRWKTFTLWINDKLGPQFESELGLKVFSLDQYIKGAEAVIALRVGVQDISSGDYDDEYVRLGDNHRGLSFNVNLDNLWFSLSVDQSDVEIHNYDTWEYETQSDAFTRFGLAVGVTL